MHQIHGPTSLGYTDVKVHSPIIRRTFLFFASAMQHDAEKRRRHRSSMMRIRSPNSHTLCSFGFGTSKFSRNNNIKHVKQTKPSECLKYTHWHLELTFCVISYIFVSVGFVFHLFRKKTLRPRPLEVTWHRSCETANRNLTRGSVGWHNIHFRKRF